MHPILHEDKGKRGIFPGSKTRQRDVTSETSPRVVQELSGRFSLRVRSVALRVCRGEQTVRQCCRARSQVLRSSSGIQAAVIPRRKENPPPKVAGLILAPDFTPPSRPLPAPTALFVRSRSFCGQILTGCASASSYPLASPLSLPIAFSARG